jgi:YhcH/YjgK/YiaL family protein
MILDHLENATLYYRLGDRLAVALRALQKPELLRADDGRHELQGADVFALVQRYDTKPRDQGRWEAHRRHIDVQYVVSGTEVMGHAQLAGMTVTEPYNAEKDVVFLDGQGNFITVAAGMFAIFHPHDAHMPGLAVAVPAPVHKIVIKIRVD